MTEKQSKLGANGQPTTSRAAIASRVSAGETLTSAVRKTLTKSTTVFSIITL